MSRPAEQKPPLVTIWPAGEARPDTSIANPAPGQASPNFTEVRLGAGGAVSIYNFQGSVNIAADVMGYFVPLSAVGDSGGPATQVVTASAALPTNVGGLAQTGGATATCPAGTTVLSGGAQSSSAILALIASFPDGANGWTGTFSDLGATHATLNVTVYAECTT